MTIAQQQTITDQASDWSQTLPFAQFDPASGTLDGIGVSLSGDILGSVAIESLEAAPSNVTVSLDSTVSVTSPTGVLLAQVSPEASASASLGADGSTTLSLLSGTAVAQALFQPGSVDLGNFVGTGSVPLTAGATSRLDVTGPANMDIASQASAGATVTLQYDYTAPQNGGSPSNAGVTMEGASAFGDVTAFLQTAGPQPVTTVPQIINFTEQTTGWTNSAAVLPFDPSLGTLQSVNITLTGDETASVAAENQDATAATLSTTQTATLSLDLPDGETAVTTATTVSDTMSLGGYDGTADFAGTSGQTDPDLNQSALSSVTLTDPTDLALFSGSGTVALPLSAVGTATLDGPGNLLARLLAQAGAVVSVSYTYLPPATYTDEPVSYAPVYEPESYINPMVVASEVSTQESWTNPAGGDWGTGSNWSSSPAAPTAGDDVAITQAGTYTITLAEAQAVDSVVLDAAGAVLVLDAPLTVTAGFTLEAGTLEFNGGSLSVGSYAQNGGLAAGGAVDIVASGAIDLNAGTIDGSNVTLNAGTSIDVASAVIIASATLDLAAGSDIGLDGGGTILTVGSFAAAPPGSLVTESITPLGSVVTPGSIGLSGSVTLETAGGVGGPIVTAGSDPPPVTWTNTAGGSWTTGSNWSSSPNVPGPTDNVVIDLAGSYTVTVTGSQTVGSVLLDDPTGTLLVNGALNAGTLTLAAGTLTVDFDGVLQGDTVLSAGGAVDFGQVNTGTLAGLTWVGPLNLTGQSVVLLGDTFQSAGGTPGTITLNSSTLSVGNTGSLDAVTLNASGSNEIAAPSAFDANGSLTLGPNAILNAGSGSVILAGSVVTNLGSITANAGDVTGNVIAYGQTVANAGSIALSHGAVLQVGVAPEGLFLPLNAGTFDNSGQIALSLGGTLEVGPGITDFINTGTIVLLDTYCALQLDGTLAASALGNVVSSGGNLLIEGLFDNTGNTLVLNGTTGWGYLGLGSPFDNSPATVRGGTIVEDGGAIRASGAVQSTSTLDGVTVRGTLAAGGLSVKDGLSVTQADGTSPGVIDVVGSLTILDGTTLDNATINLGSGGSSGIEILAGQIIASDGTLNLGADATLNLAGPSTRLFIGSVVNAGTIEVADGGALDIDSAGSQSFVSTGTIVLGATGNELDIGGSFSVATLANLGSIVSAGGVVKLTGTFNNVGNTLTVNSNGFLTPGGAYQDVILAGTVQGGTIVNAGSASLEGGGTLTLANVVWDGPLSMYGGTVNLAAGSTVEAIGGGPASIAAYYGQLGVAGTLDSVSIDLETSTLSGGAAGFTLGPHGTLSLSGETPLVSGSFTNQGLVTIDTTSAYFSGPTIVNAGSISVGGTYSQASFGSGIPGVAYTLAELDNQGTMTASGPDVEIDLDATTLRNEGLIEVSNGADLAIGGFQTLLSTGSIVVADRASIVVITGSLSSTDLGAITGAGGTLEVTGALDNTGNVLNIGTADAFATLLIPPLWYSGGGTIYGGTIAVDAGGTLGLGGTLNGVVLQSPLDLTDTNLTIVNGLSLTPGEGGVAAVILNASTLNLVQSQTLTGYTIEAGTSISFLTTGGILTLDSNSEISVSGTAGGRLEIDGQYLDEGVIDPYGDGYSNSTFVNLGTVSVSGSGESIELGTGTLVNAGLLTASNGATLDIEATAFTNTGTIALADATATLILGGSLSAPLGGIVGNGGTLILTGTLNNNGSTLAIGTSDPFSSFGLGRPSLSSGYGTYATVIGGTIQADAGGAVAFNYGALDGVQLELPELTLNGGRLAISNGLDLATASAGPAPVALLNTSTLVLLDAETLSNLAITVGAGANALAGSATTLTLASNTSIGFGAGTAEALFLTGGTVTNDGSIGVSGTGNELAVGATSFINAGQVTVTGGAALFLDSPPPGSPTASAGAFSNTGTISLDAASTLVVGGTITPAALAGIQTSGGLVELLGTLVNTGGTLTLAAGASFGNFQIGGLVNGIATPGDIQGGAVVDQGGSLTLSDATLDGVTWQGPIDVGGTGEYLSILDSFTLLPLSGNGPGVIDLTGGGDTISFDSETLANVQVDLGAVGGDVWFGNPTDYGPVFISPIGFGTPELTLAATTTLDATTPGAGTINLTGGLVNQGLIDDTEGNVSAGTFTPPPSDYPGFPIYVFPPNPSPLDNQGTIVAAAGAGSNFTIGDLTILSNEGLIQVANDDDLIVLTSTFTNTGTMSIAAGSTIAFSGTVGNIGTIAFSGTGGVLRLDNPGGVTGTLLNWSIGDEIVLPGGTGYAATVNNGTLDISQNNALLAAFIVGTSASASDFPLSAAGGGIVIGPSVVSWTNVAGGDWGSATDWSSTPTEPGAASNVAITLAGTYGVSVNGSQAVNSVLLNDAGAALTVNGTLSIGDTAAFEAGSVTLNGTLAAADAAAIVANAVTLSTNLGFGTAVIDASLDNTGVVQVNHGTLTLNGGGSSNAFGLQAAANAVLEFGASTGTIESTFSLTGGRYQGLDTVISGSTLDASAASGVVFGTLQLSASGELLLGANNAQANAGFTQETTGPGGATGTPFLWGTGTFTVFGGANLSGGQELDTGLTRLYGVSVIGGTAGFSIEDGRTVENDGWLNWSSGSIQLGNEDYPIYPLTTGGTLDNVAGATFYITASGARIANGIGGVVDNAGIIAVYAGGSGVAFGDSIYNTGYVQVQSGTLALNDGGSSNASNLYVAPGAELEFGVANGLFGLPISTPTFTLTGGSFNAGTVLINGTTVDATAASGLTIGTLRLAASGALLLGAGNGQTNGAFLQGPTTDLNATGMPFLSGSGTFTVFGGASLTNGVESGSGTTRLYGVSSIGGAPAFELDGGRTVENDGWLNWSSGDITLGAGDAAAVTQSGTLTNVAGATFFVTASGYSINNVAGGVLNNAGVMAVYAGGGEVDIDAAVTNTGYIQALSGTLSLNGGGISDAGGLVVGSGAVLQFGTAASGTGGTFTFTGGVYDVATTQITGGTVDLSAASGAVFGSSLAISGGGALLLGGLYTGTETLGLADDGTGGTLSDSGNFTVSSFAELGDGVLTGGGVVVLDGYSSIVGALQLDGGGALQNDAALTWSSGSIALGSGDTGAASQAGYINNVAGATFEIECDGSLTSPGSGAVFNEGTIEKLGGSGTTSVQALIDNTGTVAVNSGTLAFAQAAIGDGTFDIGASAKLDFASVVDSNATIAFIGGGGTLAIDSGSFGATVEGFVSGDHFDFTAVQFALTPTLSFTQGSGSGTLAVTDGVHSVAFTMTGTYAQSDFKLSDDGNHGTTVSYS